MCESFDKKEDSNSTNQSDVTPAILDRESRILG